jgi:predicted enzyme related to lactoylglutathione lyase
VPFSCKRRGFCPSCGAVTFLQRFGSALNLNLHTLALDGAYRYAAGDPEAPHFLVLPPTRHDEVARVLAGTARRLHRLLEACADENHDALARDEPLRALLAAASLRTRIAAGPHRGMSLHVAAAVPSRDRRRLERLCLCSRWPVDVVSSKSPRAAPAEPVARFRPQKARGCIMSDVRPYGATRDARFGFSKVFVQDLHAMAAFYEEVFGLIPLNRHEDVMLGRKIDEITYQATDPGGGSLTLIQYLDSKGPITGESVLGFTTSDIHALVKRAELAGGRLGEPIRRIEEFKLQVGFVLDPEGHVNEVVEMDA